MDTIPSNPNDVTARNGQEHAEGNDPINHAGSTETELDPKTKEGFQRLVAKKDKEAKDAADAAREAREELRKLQEEKRRQKLSELDETERLKQERDEAIAANAKLKMQNFASREWNKRGLKADHDLYEIVSETPWLVPFVRRSLGDSPSWEEVIRGVEDKLPVYLDQLASKKEVTPATPELPSDTPSNPSPSNRGDAERQPNDSSKKRIWSRKEIAKLSNADYAKYRSEINQAMVEGRIRD